MLEIGGRSRRKSSGKIQTERDLASLASLLRVARGGFMVFGTMVITAEEVVYVRLFYTVLRSWSARSSMKSQETTCNATQRSFRFLRIPLQCIRTTYRNMNVINS